MVYNIIVFRRKQKKFHQNAILFCFVLFYWVIGFGFSSTRLRMYWVKHGGRASGMVWEGNLHSAPGPLIARQGLPSNAAHCCCLSILMNTNNITSTPNHPYGLLRGKFQIPSSCVTQTSSFLVQTPPPKWSQPFKLFLTQLIGRNKMYEYILFIQYKFRLWLSHDLLHPRLQYGNHWLPLTRFPFPPRFQPTPG